MLAIRRTLFTTDDAEVVQQLQQLPKECYYLEHNGRVYQNLEDIGPRKLIQIHFRMCGGKGGFGSLLRSFRIHKSTNQLMCRDLSGRRLADVKEEEKLQKWIARKEEREKEKERKKHEKYERLKRGPAKHEFTDQKYLKARDTILDQTEDAIEAGMRAMAEASGAAEDGGESSTVDGASAIDAGDLAEEVLASSSSSDDSTDDDFDFYASPHLTLGGSSSSNGNGNSVSRKRKSAKNGQDSRISKRLKLEYTSNIIFEYFTEKIIEEIAQLALFEAQKANKQREIQNEKNSEDSVHKPTNVTFSVVNFEEFASSVDLEQLGLEHLKHALEVRGLKCGGSLAERASRLFSVKGLSEAQYPKNIRAKPAKK